MQVVLAQPRGFCAGVVRAIEIVELALDIYGPPVYVFHEIVHNRHVVEDLQTRGAVFIEDLDAVPTGSVTIFSAHGVSTAVVDQAKRRKLQVIDATCPLVTKVHLQAQQYSRRGYETIIIGHIGHEEVEGTMGSVEGPVYVVSTTGDVAALTVKNPDKLAYVTQTTLSIDDTRDVIDALKQRFPTIQGPELDDICYATQNRQNAVRALADEVNLLLVVGARNSSNSNRLREVGEQHGVPAYLIQDETELDKSWFENVKKVGITSGASTPEVLVQRVLDKLRTFGVNVTRELDGIRETTTFRLPKSLTLKKAEQTKSAAVAKVNS
ncbi:MAG TPA: 4-hydroxy-3-methylbut-2-enyl diphosphate reductase [Burkholderiales bacterium]|nr:4-hydroxy-3-methylbut-2-enyl diphosphate reductase [Burkholderiales bacterium]